MNSTPMPPENDRRTRDADHHPLERAVDKSGVTGHFARLNAKIAEYRVLVWLVVSIALFLGWRFEGPGARISKVETEIVSVKDSIKAVRKGQDSTHNALEVLVRLNCFDTTTTYDEKRLAGLDCEGIERARRQKKKTSSVELAPDIAARVYKPSLGNGFVARAHAQEPKR